VRDRAIIVLNNHRFWGYASGPRRQATRSHRPSIAGTAMPLAAAPLPRERFSPLTQRRHPGASPQRERKRVLKMKIINGNPQEA